LQFAAKVSISLRELDDVLCKLGKKKKKKKNLLFEDASYGQPHFEMRLQMEQILTCLNIIVVIF
jgi:hypothetical protein